MATYRVVELKVNKRTQSLKIGDSLWDKVKRSDIFYLHPTAYNYKHNARSYASKLKNRHNIIVVAQEYDENHWVVREIL